MTIPKPGDVLAVVVLYSPEWHDVHHPHLRARLERGTVIDGDRSTVNTHVWVRSERGATMGLTLNDEGTSWVPSGDEEALGAMIALRALAGLPAIEP